MVSAEDRQGPFVAVDCSVPERVLERQVFDVLRYDDLDGGERPRRALLMRRDVFLEEVGKLSSAAGAPARCPGSIPARNRGQPASALA